MTVTTIEELIERHPEVEHLPRSILSFTLHVYADIEEDLSKHAHREAIIFAARIPGKVTAYSVGTSFITSSNTSMTVYRDYVYGPSPAFSPTYVNVRSYVNVSYKINSLEVSEREYNTYILAHQ